MLERGTKVKYTFALRSNYVEMASAKRNLFKKISR